MLVLGIDPGTRLMGWGLVRGQQNRLTHVAHGVFRALPTKPLSERLLLLRDGLSAVIAQHQPQCGAVETLFFHKDPQAAAKLGHARGVVLLTLEQHSVRLSEYAPARVKSMLTGSGRAAKTQVAHMVKTLLNLQDLPPPDAADALALAITHLRREPLDQRLESRPTNAALTEILARSRRSRRARTV